MEKRAYSSKSRFPSRGFSVTQWCVSVFWTALGVDRKAGTRFDGGLPASCRRTGSSRYASRNVPAEDLEGKTGESGKYFIESGIRRTIT